jgi:hypothetical protein
MGKTLFSLRGGQARLSCSVSVHDFLTQPCGITGWSIEDNHAFIAPVALE